MLKFRNINYEKDVDEIIKLLNANFDTNHTKEAFLWKHFENPFGKSYGLLAVDNERIVGLRMFMRWEFLFDKNIVKAIRPVDTCTDHDYRGQGLFKKITLQGLQNIREEYELVFNTPNSNSLPGYLKMGWKLIEKKFNYKVGLINFLRTGENFQHIRSQEIKFEKSWGEELSCQTNISLEYLVWRYKSAEYKIAEFEDKGVIVYKLAKLKGIQSVVLLDSFGIQKGMKKKLTAICSKNDAKAIYFLDNEKNKNLSFLINFNRGSQAVVSKDDEFGISGKIAFSVGDLEGRI
jgi:hypothetical protein